MKRNLIQIAQDQAALDELLQSVEGELTPILEGFLDEVQTNLAVKADNYASMLDSISDTAKRYRARAEEYRQAAKAAENVVERMKDRIYVAMRMMGVQEVHGKSIRFKLQNSPPHLVFDGNLMNLPAEYKIVTVTADNEKIKQDLKDGKPVPGARLEQGQHVRRYLNKGDL